MKKVLSLLVSALIVSSFAAVSLAAHHEAKPATPATPADPAAPGQVKKEEKKKADKKPQRERK